MHGNVQTAEVLKPTIQAARGDFKTKNVQAAMASAGLPICETQAARAKRAIMEDMHKAYLDGFKALEDMTSRFKASNPNAVATCTFRRDAEGKRHWVGTFIMLPQVPVGPVRFIQFTCLALRRRLCEALHRMTALIGWLDPASPKGSGWLHPVTCQNFFLCSVSQSVCELLRPMLFVDFVHFNGPTEGGFICASALDGNEHIYPLAIALVDGENLATCSFFFRSLASAPQESWQRWIQSPHLVVFTNRSQSFMSALATHIPTAFNM